MRGRPWLRSLFVLLAFAALAVPVWRLTRPASDATAAIVAATGAPDKSAVKAVRPADELTVSVDFAPPPREFLLQHLGRTLLEGRGPQASFAGKWTVALPKEGADLALHATWPEDGQAPAAAAQLRVTFPDGRTVEKTCWARQPASDPATSGAAATPLALVEIFTVPGASPAMP